MLKIAYFKNNIKIEHRILEQTILGIHSNAFKKISKNYNVLKNKIITIIIYVNKH